MRYVKVGTVATAVAIVAVAFFVIFGRPKAPKTYGLSAMATGISVAESLGRPAGSIQKSGDFTLIGRRSNRAYYASLVRRGRHVNGQMNITTFGPASSEDIATVGLFGMLDGHTLRLRVWGDALGVRTLTGWITGRDLILSIPRSGYRITLRPGATEAYNRLTAGV